MPFVTGRQLDGFDIYSAILFVCDAHALQERVGPKGEIGGIDIGQRDTQAFQMIRRSDYAVDPVVDFL